MLEITSRLGNGLAVETNDGRCVILRVLAVRGSDIHVSIRAGDEWDLDDGDIVRISLAGGAV